MARALEPPFAVHASSDIDDATLTGEQTAGRGPSPRPARLAGFARIEPDTAVTEIRPAEPTQVTPPRVAVWVDTGMRPARRRPPEQETRVMAALDAGATFGPFSPTTPLSGSVFRAVEELPNGSRRMCALKRFFGAGGPAGGQIEAFAEEARISLLLEHRNIPRCLRAGEIGGVPYIAFELIEGLDLRALLDRGDLPIDAVLEIGIGICSALRYAHNLEYPAGRALRLVHRDLCPENIRISERGRPFLLDFGICRFRDRRHATLGGVVKGKLLYMPPEQLHGGEVDARTDLFALGVVLAEMVAGHRLEIPATLGVPALASDLRLHLRRQCPRTAAVPGLLQLIEALTSLDPRGRPGDAAEVLDRLEQMRERRGGPPVLPQLMARELGLAWFEPPALERPRERARTGVAIAVLAGLTLAAAGVLLHVW
jgi:serine/threonine protein kinase